ncbi:hypothetical protein H4219_000989 [Mycoemilia scoparia]|uniref:Uncharacterized protein n=1 Tax=Mycoemilia scoparia TaxID=417184 RepID=A0A9W8A270_9FUNG|nr:hypothetical protein H4219_000989 [Mycoemilia scoparia]
MDVVIDSANLNRGAEGDSNTHLHQLPCSIDHNGSAEADVYFNPKPTQPTPEQPDPQTIEASFRGRELVGIKAEIPKGHSVYIVEKATMEFPRQRVRIEGLGEDEVADEEMETKSVWLAKKKASSINVWGHGLEPSRHSDKTIKAMDWIQVSNLIHGANF